MCGSMENAWWWRRNSVELMVRDGDYLPDGRGGFRRAEGREALLQRVLWKLSIRRGCFPLLPGLGSRLYLLCRQHPGRREGLARQYAAEALAGEEDLEVTGTRLERDGRLQVELLWKGQTLRVTAEVE